MKLITAFALTNKNTDELYGLYRLVFNELAKYPTGTIEHSNALASLQNIQREINARSLSF